MHFARKRIFGYFSVGLVFYFATIDDFLHFVEDFFINDSGMRAFYIGTSLVDQTSCFFPFLFALRLNHGEVSILYINKVHLSIGFLEFN